MPIFKNLPKIKKMFRNAVAVAAAIVISVTFTATASETAPQVHRETYALAEASTGTVIRQSGGDERVRMGSLNKLMVVLLAAEAVQRGDMSLDTVITAGENANSKQGAQIWLDVGEKMTLSDLLKAVIIGNANDACCAVAEAMCGSEAGCVGLMNARAAELSMNGTLFTECTGYYDDENQYTTASDAVKLLCRLSELDFLREMFTTRVDELKNGGVQLVSTNTMGHRYKGSIGFKCGFGPASGYFAAEGAEREGIVYVCAVLDCGDEDRSLALARELLDIAFEGYTLVSPGLPDNMPDRIAVREGQRNEARLSAEPVGSLVVPKGRGGDVRAEVFLPSGVYAPLERGGKVGELRFYLGDRLLKSCNINSADDIEAKNFRNVLSLLMKFLVSF